MIPRSIEKYILQALQSVPVVALLGSRQTGKTTLAKVLSTALTEKKALYLDLELDSDRMALNQAELFLRSHENDLVIIDEIQRKPDLFPLLRALVDQNRIPGRFLILGSASPALVKHSSESLAGRIRLFEVPPFTLPELSGSDWYRLWLRGGYPNSYLATSDEESFRWRFDFLSTYLERDLPSLGFRMAPSQVRRCLTMLAHNQSQLWNASAYGNSLGLTAPTVKHYLDVLTDTYLVRTLSPYFVNVGKRLIKSPKVHLRDTGLVHALLGIQTWDQLMGHPIAGPSWESFVIETILRSLPFGWEGFFYRTSAGAEIDLVLVSPQGQRIAIEVKFSQAPVLTKGFHLSRQDLQTELNYMVYPGTHAVPLGNNTTLVPLTDLLSTLGFAQ